MSADDQVPPELEHQEIEDLKAIIRTWRNIQGWCRINRWIVLAIFAGLVSFSQFTDAIKSLFQWKH